MTYSDSAKQVEILEQHLKVLREQEAKFGSAYVPAHIVIEIQRIEAQLAELVLQRTQQMFDAQHLPANPPAFARGLITAVSLLGATQALKDQAAFQAIDYHRTLRRCWLIATSAKNTQCSEPTTHELINHFSGYGIEFSIHLLENGADPFEMQELVSTIYSEIEAADVYNPDELICDITSGTKAMTLGMALACGSTYRMQYMLAYDTKKPSLPMLFQVDD